MKYLLIPAFKFLYAVFMSIWAIAAGIIIIPIYVIWNGKFPEKDFYQVEVDKNYTFHGDAYSPYLKIPDGYKHSGDNIPTIKFKTYLHFLWNIK